MQFELALAAPAGADYAASDLGYLLHKHPARLHERHTSAGTARVFFTEAGEARASAVLHLDVDAVGLVRGRGGNAAGAAPLAAYVSDRAYCANSYLSVALGKLYAQSMAGRSKERQSLAERALPFTARIEPVSGPDAAAVARRLFEPLGYRVTVNGIGRTAERELVTLELEADVRLDALLRHVQVLLPVLDDAKHWWVDADEIEVLMAKAGDWLADHPERDLVVRRALKRRRALADELLERLDEGRATEPAADAADAADVVERESALERPLGLHDRRLDRVAELLAEARVTSVVDIGCGEGRLLQRLLADGRIVRLLGVDPSLRELERARDRLYLDRAGDALRERLTLAPGSLAYADRRWRDFDAATLVEVIEHVDPERHAALELILFGDAHPPLVIVTTPNRDYNARFERLPAGHVRHPDHRFEWTRAEFAAWCGRVAATHGYAVEIEPLGDVDAELGAPSQIGIFRQLSRLPGAAA